MPQQNPFIKHHLSYVSYFPLPDKSSSNFCSLWQSDIVNTKIYICKLQVPRKLVIRFNYRPIALSRYSKQLT